MLGQKWIVIDLSLVQPFFLNNLYEIKIFLHRQGICMGKDSACYLEINLSGLERQNGYERGDALELVLDFFT
ncbi:hypothetical protein PPYC2_16385 [Paenibacillus polymyxa]|jgi:hypothetical protein|nr:hypothetical protein PPYC2_16385 [Paenibacillus polymyxa]